MNAPLFRRVNARILAEPAAVWMNTVWMRVTKRWRDLNEELKNLDCGSAGCYCGHTIFEAKPSLFRKQFSNYEMAAKLLDVPEREAALLFNFFGDFTGPYRDLKEKLDLKKPGTLGYARIVVQAANRCMKRNKNKHYDGYLKDDKTVAERAA